MTRSQHYDDAVSFRQALEVFPDPPTSCKKSYAVLAASCHIDVDIDTAVVRLREYHRRVITFIKVKRV